MEELLAASIFLKDYCVLVNRPARPLRSSAERWFAEVTTKWTRRRAHRSVRDLVASIRTWIVNWNDVPKPYAWHKSADEILEGLASYCQTD